MSPRHLPDQNVVIAQVAPARPAISVAEARQHINQSFEAYERSQRLLRAAMPVLPYRDKQEDGDLQIVEG